MDFQNQPWQNNQEEKQQGPYGIGGWLAFFTILRFLSVTVLAATIIKYLTAPEAGAIFASAAGYIFILLMVLYTLFIGLEIATIILLFKANILFRRLFVINVISNVAVLIVLSILLSSLLNVGSLFDLPTFLSLGLSIIWIVYLYRSERVKNTFPPRKNKEGKDQDDAGWSHPPAV